MISLESIYKNKNNNKFKKIQKFFEFFKNPKFFKFAVIFILKYRFCNGKNIYWSCLVSEFKFQQIFELFFSLPFRTHLYLTH